MPLALRVFPSGLGALALLLITSPANAAVFSAGPTGTHATVQGAIDAALSNVGDDEVRIQAGTWAERVSFVAFNAERTDISGGWNAAFDERTANPAATVIDGGRLGQALHVEANTGTLTLRNFSLRRGSGATSGGNFSLVARATSSVEVSDCDIGDGDVQAIGVGGSGAGVMIQAFDDAYVALERCRVHDHLVQTDGQTGSGAGAHVTAFQESSVLLANLMVDNNRIVSATGSAAALHLTVGMDAVAEVRDSDFVDNRVEGNSTNQSGPSGVLLSAAFPPATARIEFRRNRVLRNLIAEGLPSVQVGTFANSTTLLIIADSLIAGSLSDGGLLTRRFDNAQVQLVNLTLAGNAGVDLEMETGGEVSNTLASTVGTGLADATVVASLFGGDPRYVDAAGGDYHLLSDSPAIGAGTLTPAGGLGLLDLDGNARVRGAGVDQGAFEADDPSLFRDGFESPG